METPNESGIFFTEKDSGGGDKVVTLHTEKRKHKDVNPHVGKRQKVLVPLDIEPNSSQNARHGHLLKTFRDHISKFKFDSPLIAYKLIRSTKDKRIRLEPSPYLYTYSHSHNGFYVCNEENVLIARMCPIPDCIGPPKLGAGCEVHPLFDRTTGIPSVLSPSECPLFEHETVFKEDVKYMIDVMKQDLNLTSDDDVLGALNVSAWTHTELAVTVRKAEAHSQSLHVQCLDEPFHFFLCSGKGQQKCFREAWNHIGCDWYCSQCCKMALLSDSSEKISNQTLVELYFGVDMDFRTTNATKKLKALYMAGRDGIMLQDGSHRHVIFLTTGGLLGLTTWREGVKVKIYICSHKDCFESIGDLLEPNQRFCKKHGGKRVAKFKGHHFTNVIYGENELKETRESIDERYQTYSSAACIQSSSEESSNELTQLQAGPIM